MVPFLFGFILIINDETRQALAAGFFYDLAASAIPKHTRQKLAAGVFFVCITLIRNKKHVANSRIVSKPLNQSQKRPYESWVTIWGVFES